MPPRFFLPSGDPRPLPALPPEQLCDLVRIGDDPSDCAVVRDALGFLTVVPAIALPPELARAAHARELVAGQPRRVSVRELWLLELQELERSANPPGVNDPVELAGRLTGPFGTNAPAEAWNGRLVVTTADLLAGYAEHAKDALPVVTDGTALALCVHAWLPGDRLEQVAGGCGGVLVYRLHPIELADDPGNELLVAELLFATLSRLRTDLQAAHIANPLLLQPVPVLDREAEILALKEAGFTIQGDTAIPNVGLSDQVIGALTTLLGPRAELDPLRRSVPKQGSFTDYLCLAREALAALPGWPDDRALALRALVTSQTAATSRLNARVPAASAPLPEAAAPTPAPRAVLPVGPAAWEADFAPAARDTKTEPRARAASARRPAPARASPKSAAPPRPAWMDDFES